MRFFLQNKLEAISPLAKQLDYLNLVRNLIINSTWKEFFFPLLSCMRLLQYQLQAWPYDFMQSMKDSSRPIKRLTLYNMNSSTSSTERIRTRWRFFHYSGAGIASRIFPFPRNIPPWKSNVLLLFISRRTNDEMMRYCTGALPRMTSSTSFEFDVGYRKERKVQNEKIR